MKTSAQFQPLHFPSIEIDGWSFSIRDYNRAIKFWIFYRFWPRLELNIRDLVLNAIHFLFQMPSKHSL